MKVSMAGFHGHLNIENGRLVYPWTENGCYKYSVSENGVPALGPVEIFQMPH